MLVVVRTSVFSLLPFPGKRFSSYTNVSDKRRVNVRGLFPGTIPGCPAVSVVKSSRKEEFLLAWFGGSGER